MSMRKLEKKGFEITTKGILEELGDDFRKTLSELGFEEAVKGYEKMRSAEWERVLKQDSLRL